MREHKLLGKPYIFLLKNKSSISQPVSLFGSESIPKDVVVLTPLTGLTERNFVNCSYSCIIGLIRVESSVPLGASGKHYLDYIYPVIDSGFEIAPGRNFKDDTNIWEYFCDIRLDKDSSLQFNILPDSELKLILCPACKISEKTPLSNKGKLSGWA